MEGITLRAPKEPPVEPYRSEHIDRMLAALDHDWKVATTPRQRMLAARDRAILFLFLESGLRLGELAGLRVGDIDLERQRAVVHDGKMGKGRVTGFGPQTKKALCGSRNGGTGGVRPLISLGGHGAPINVTVPSKKPFSFVSSGMSVQLSVAPDAPHAYRGARKRNRKAIEIRWRFMDPVYESAFYLYRCSPCARSSRLRVAPSKL